MECLKNEWRGTAKKYNKYWYLLKKSKFLNAKQKIKIKKNIENITKTLVQHIICNTGKNTPVYAASTLSINHCFAIRLKIVNER